MQQTNSNQTQNQVSYCQLSQWIPTQCRQESQQKCAQCYVFATNNLSLKNFCLPQSEFLFELFQRLNIQNWLIETENEHKTKYYTTFFFACSYWHTKQQTCRRWCD